MARAKGEFCYQNCSKACNGCPCDTCKDLMERDRNGVSKLDKLVITAMKKNGNAFGLNDYVAIMHRDNYTDYYDMAINYLCPCINKFNGTGSFGKYFISCMDNKVKSVYRDQQAQCRRLNYDHDYLDEPVSEEADSDTVGDFVEDKRMNTSMEAINNIEPESLDMSKLSSLTEVEKRIVILMSEQYNIREINNILKSEGYDINRNKLKDIKNGLFERYGILESKEKEQNMVEHNEDFIRTNDYGVTGTKSMSGVMTVSDYITCVSDFSLNNHYPLQRAANQWPAATKSALIVTMLNGYKIAPIIIAEESTIPTREHLIDGLQRMSTIQEFIEDKFPIAKKADRALFKYKAARLDDDGNPIMDGDDYIYDIKEYDSAGKYFSQMPANIQKMITMYSVHYEKYLACTKEDIEYHIKRFNSGKPMSAPQKGIINIGTSHAYVAKDISANSKFLNSFCNFKPSEYKNGTVDRVVIESVMAINYLDDWKKKQEDMCSFLKHEATKSDFTRFGILLEDLWTALPEECDELAEMFNSKDTFIYLSVANKFSDDYANFFKFLQWFRDRGMRQRINGTNYEDLNTKATKDKKVVIAKIEMLNSLIELGRWETYSKDAEQGIFSLFDDGCKPKVEEDGVEISKEVNIYHGKYKIYDEGIQDMVVRFGKMTGLENADELMLKAIMLSRKVGEQYSDDAINEFADNFCLPFEYQIQDYIVAYNHIQQDFDRFPIPINMAITEPHALPLLIALAHNERKEANIKGLDLFGQWLVEFADEYEDNYLFALSPLDEYNDAVKSLNKYVSENKYVWGQIPFGDEGYWKEAEDE